MNATQIHRNRDRQQIANIAEQIGSSLMPDTDKWVNRFTVESTSSSKLYTVSQRRTDGVWGCSCRGWINHRRCKHLTDVLGRLAQLDLSELEAARELLESARMAFIDLSDPIPVAAYEPDVARITL